MIAHVRDFLRWDKFSSDSTYLTTAKVWLWFLKAVTTLLLIEALLHLDCLFLLSSPSNTHAGRPMHNSIFTKKGAECDWELPTKELQEICFGPRCCTTMPSPQCQCQNSRIPRGAAPHLLWCPKSKRHLRLDEPLETDAVVKSGSPRIPKIPCH